MHVFSNPPVPSEPPEESVLAIPFGARRWLAILLSVTMALSSSGAATIAAAEAKIDDPQTIALAAQMSASLTAIEDGDREAARDRWDPQFVVDTVGTSSDDLFRWMRESVGWVPYRGALRGPQGVLMDRVGNSLDQSLLLAALLRSAGKNARLAHAQLAPQMAASEWQWLMTPRAPGLSASEASAVEETTVPPTPDEVAAAPSTPTASSAPAAGTPAPNADAASPLASPPTQLPPETPAPLAQIASSDNAAAFADALAPATPTDEILSAAEDYEIDTASVNRELEKTTVDTAMLGLTMENRSNSQTMALIDLVSLSPGDAAAAEAAGQAALADHWWVQVQEIGAWRDLDLLEPSGVPGVALAPAVATMAVDALPADMESKVTIRVIGEQWKVGATQERLVLEHVLRPRDLQGQTISFQFFPMKWPTDWNKVAPDDIQIKLRAALYTQSEWLPIMVIGSDQFVQASVKDNGEINPNPTPANPFASMMVPAVGMLTKAADLLAARPSSVSPEEKAANAAVTPPRPEGELVGEWIEYEIQSPGVAPRKVRREVFDLIGPAARQAGQQAQFTMSKDLALARSMAQLRQSSIGIFPTQLAPEYISHLSAQNILANRDSLKDITSDPFGDRPANIEEILSKITTLPAPLYLYATLRMQHGPFVGSVFVDRPQIVAMHGILTKTGREDIVTKYEIDVVDNGVGVDPRLAVEAPAIRLAQGIVDTNAESLAIEMAAGDVAVKNTGFAFAEAIKAGTPWAVFRPGDEGKIAAIGLSSDVAERMSQDLRGGKIVVAAAKARSDLQGWWRIDPATGETLGVSANGHGAAMVEYAFILVIEMMFALLECQLRHSGYLPGGGPSHVHTFMGWAMAAQCAAQGALNGIRQIVSMEMMRFLTRQGWARPPALPTGGAPQGPQANNGTGSPNGPGPGSTQGRGPPVGSPPPGSQPPGNKTQPTGPPKGSPPPGNKTQPMPKGSPPPGDMAMDKTQPAPKQPSVDPDPVRPRTPINDLNDANRKVDQAEGRAVDAKKNYDANRTPEAKGQFDKAVKDYQDMMNDRLNWWHNNRPPGAQEMPRPGVQPKSPGSFSINAPGGAVNGPAPEALPNVSVSDYNSKQMAGQLGALGPLGVPAGP